MTQTTHDRVIKIIAEYLGKTPDALPDELVDLGFDSLDKVELVVALEDEFGTSEIIDEQADDLKTIANWVDMVVMHVGDLR